MADQIEPSRAPGHTPAVVWKALTTMFATQTGVVMGTLSVPVLAPAIAQPAGVAPSLIGYHASAVFAVAMLAVIAVPPWIARYGSVRVSQATCVLAAAGLAAAAGGWLWTLVLSAFLLGLAYGPANPSSSVLLARVTTPEVRGRIFSAKQIAVPLGGVLAGSLVPVLAEVTSWRTALLAVSVANLGLAGLAGVWRRELDPERAPQISDDILAPLRLVWQSVGLRALAIVSFCLAAVQFSFGATFVAFIHTTTDAGMTRSGAIVSVAMAMSVGLRFTLGVIADRVGGTRMLFVSGLVVGAAALACALLAESTYLPLALAGIVLGAMSFSWNGVFLSEVAAAAPGGRIAAATAGTMLATYLGGALGPGVFTAVTALGGYRSAFLFLAALGAVATLASAAARSTPGR